MGFRGMSFSSLLLIFLIVLLVFGTKRLRTIGEDLGRSIKSFRKGLQESHEEFEADESNQKKVVRSEEE